MTNENQDNSDNSQDAAATIDHDPNEKPQMGGAKRGFAVKVGLALAAVIGIGAVVAVAQGGPGGWKSGMGHMGARFAEHRVESMLEDIDASADQETKIWAIIDKTRSELRPVGREFRDTREQVVALLSAPTIDREAVEKLRSERIAAIDEASKKAVSAIVEAAEVLTPEQRTKLVAEMKERHEDRKDRRGHMKGRHGDRMGGNDDRP
ncbi:MAG: periplasmic heavy metal sensor [Rhizobiaceae bacterium]